MKVLLDADQDVALRHEFAESPVAETADYRGWKQLDNGDLFRTAEQKYNVLIMLDKGIPHQQNMTGFDIAVVTLDAGYPGGTAEQKALMPTVNRLLPDVRPGEVYTVTPSGTSRP
jgi:hypothetical protein